MEIIGVVTPPRSETEAYAATNSRIDNIISAVTTDTEVTDIRVGADGVTYQTAATAVNTQFTNLTDEVNRYKNGERNAVLTTGATANEKAVFDNLLYIKAYGIDLSDYYVSTVINSEQYPYHIILKKDNSPAIVIDNPDGSENFCYFKTDDSFIVIGYKWSNHVNDINLSFGSSHIKILDSVHSTDSMMNYLDQKITASQSAIADIQNDIETINGNLTDYAITGPGTVISALEGAYITINLPIAVHSIASANFRCTVYSVSAGSVYRIKAENYALNAAYPAVAFTTTRVTAVDTVLENPQFLYSADQTRRNVDFLYTCTQNGYIVIAWINSITELKLYETEQINRINKLENIVNTIESPESNLIGKSVAVLGDSIMMRMRTNYSGTNTVSYLGSDGNTYTFDQLTNINGKLFVAADNSISCTVVNSNQNKLDNQNWEALKSKTGAADIINCGLGGAKVREREVITEYPYPDGDGQTTCLSNEVKMLKRLVQGGRPSPDCIIIWAGTNDAVNNFGNDNYDEIMAMEYNTLADDALGRTYRQTFYGGLRYTLETLYREYPYATIFVFTPIQTNPSNSRTYSKLTTFGNALKKMAERYSCIFVNSLTEIGIVDLLEASDGSGNFLADGLHPNENGKKLFANFTAKKLNTLYFSKR